MAKAAQKAYTLVRQKILSGDYPPSLRITEQEIADASGVSRTPVREALQRLQNEGLVRVTANQGAVVMDWNEDDVSDVFELRAVLEPYGAARAAARISAEGVARLRELAEAQYEESENRRPGYTGRIGALNSEFHRTLHECADSPRLSMLMPMLIEAPLMMRTFTRYEAAELLRSASHHLEIVAALEAGDADWAAAVMRSHVLAAQRSLIQHAGESAPAARSAARTTVAGDGG
ncbi:MAG: GntR family transcriptional regulator [Lysobacterales bacterium]|jgi:DNA-binding GntR family transcriptional regulator